MSLPEILLIALGLSMDAFAVSISSGANRCICGYRSTFMLSFHFGLFQFLMPVAGWFIGEYVVQFVESFDHWIAFLLLGFVGLKMIISFFKHKPDKELSNPSKGFELIILSIATSIDAFVIGLSFALLKVDIWYPAVIIGIVTALLSILGIKIGNFLGKKFGTVMELIGGIILISIGIKVLISHLF